MYPLRAIASPSLARPCAAATLALFLMASVGYPVWSGGGVKDLSHPFPCMHRRCGCRSAEQCWRGCCCFTNQQKLAWAKEKGVAPPEYVVVAAKQENKQPAKTSCCSTQGSGSCHVAKAKTGGKPSLTAVIEAMTCLGQIEQWVALGAIDLPHIEGWHLEWPFCGEIATVDVSYSADALPPAPPPPWS